MHAPLLHGAVAFMFELADAKQEYSEMLNCSTKDWPQSSPITVDRPPPQMPQQPQKWAGFSLQKAGSCVLKRFQWSYLVKLELTEF